MINPGTGTGSTIFLATEATEMQTFAAPRVGTRTQQLTRYLADDLHMLVKDGQIDLAYWLGIPPSEYITDSEFLADIICNDIEQILRDGFIRGVHFLLSDTQPDPMSGCYNLRYHVQYRIDIPVRQLSDDALQQSSDRLQLPRDASLGARFALLIDWNPQLNPAEIELVRRPRYFFDWVPINERYGATSLVRYRTDGLTTEIVQIESTVARNISK